jgi:hypothetical protein
MRSTIPYTKYAIIRHNKELDRLALRGWQKVDTQ